MLPFQPEPETVLKSRYNDAVDNVMDVNHIAANPSKRPGLLRQHVFDFYDGLRLIISRETDGSRTYTHYSGSMYPTNKFEKAGEFTSLIFNHVNSLRPTPLSGQCKVFGTKKGIIHLMYDENQPKGFGGLRPVGNPLWN